MWTKWTLNRRVLYVILFFLEIFLQVDGLIRLMEGENTGPINLGNPGNVVSYYSALHGGV